MKRGSEEFDQMQAQFEKDCQHLGRMRLDSRIPKDRPVIPTEFYDHGETNAAFRAYMLGYSNARCLYGQGGGK